VWSSAPVPADPEPSRLPNLDVATIAETALGPTCRKGVKIRLPLTPSAVPVAARSVSGSDLWTRGQFWWHSPTIAGGRQGPPRPVVLAEHSGTIGAEASVADPKAREGSPSVGSNLTATAIYQVKHWSSHLPVTGCLCGWLHLSVYGGGLADVP
jgi:hypothetical protein